MRILIIEHDFDLALRERQALEREGHHVAVAETGRRALELAEKWMPDLVLLEMRLPDADGRDLARSIRSHGDVLIVIVSESGDEAERLSGLEAGADDYLVKPVSLAELLTRVRTLMRLGRMQPDGASILVHGDLELDQLAHRVRAGGRELDLTPTEFEIVRLLLARPGEVVRREDLAREVWGVSARRSRKRMDVHLSAIRTKLGDDAENPCYIETVRGVGFRLAQPPSEESSS